MYANFTLDIKSTARSNFGTFNTGERRATVQGGTEDAVRNYVARARAEENEGASRGGPARVRRG